MERNIVNQSLNDNILGIPFQNLPTTNDQIVIYQLDSSGNGYFIFGNISTAGGIIIVTSSGSGASIINNVTGGTLTLKSILSNTPNIIINNLSNQLELTLGPNLTNIYSISNSNPISILPGTRSYLYQLESGLDPIPDKYDFMLYEGPNGVEPGYFISISDNFSDTDRELVFECIRNNIKTYPMRINNSGAIIMDIPMITPSVTLGLDINKNIGYYNNPATIASVANIGTGGGKVFADIVSDTINLRTLKGDSNILISTVASEININLTNTLQSINSIGSTNLSIDSALIHFPDIPMSTPTMYLGLDGSDMCSFLPPTTLSSVTSAGTGNQIYKSYTSGVLTLKSLAVGNSLNLADDTNTLTLSLPSSININTITGTGLTINSSTVNISTLTTTASTVVAVSQDTSGRLFQSPLKTTFNNLGGGTPIYDVISSTNNALNFNTLVVGNSINLNSGGGQISIGVTTTMADMQIVNSLSGTTQFNSTVTLQSTSTVTLPPYYLSLDGSNNITKVVPPTSTSINLYNTDGTITTSNRLVNGFNPLSIDNKIIFNNVGHSFVNSIRYNPSYLGTTIIKKELNFIRFYDSFGDSWGKYEATNYETRTVAIPSIGAAGNFNVFYVSRADGFLQNAVWILKVYIFESDQSNINAYVAMYDIEINAPNNGFNYQSVYPTRCTNNKNYLLELGQAVVGNPYTLALRLRNYGSSSIFQPLTAKIESYGVADKDITTPLTTGNLAINTVGQTFPISIPVIGQFNNGTNSGGTLTSILWAYNNFPRQVRVIYDISAQSQTAGLSVNFQFTNNGFNLFSRVFRTGVNNTFTTISGSWLINVPVAIATGLLTYGTNTFTGSATSNPTAITLLNHTYCINFEFLN